jgi:4-hydroxy-2-oxoheptanedioate aldolase
MIPRDASNRFKQAIKAPDAQIGLWLGLADPYSAELCATAGYDWLLIDGEHGPNDLRSMLSILQAIAPYSSSPVVRIPHGDTTLIKQVLEIGATTLLVPMVETAEQARALVQATRYPPHGVRGVGSGLARSSRWSSIPDYLNTANDQICLLVQVETASAMDRIEEIATVDGVDGVFIGPADLAASMGFLGRPDEASVQATIVSAIAKILAAGRAPGILTTDETLAHQYIALGARFVAVGVEATLMAQSTRALLSRFRNARQPGARSNSSY